jgi:hypothetical protein
MFGAPLPSSAQPHLRPPNPTSTSHSTPLKHGYSSFRTSCATSLHHLRWHQLLRVVHHASCVSHHNIRGLHLKFEQLRTQLLSCSPLPSLVEMVTIAQTEDICLYGVMSSSSTILATSTMSLTLAPTSTPALVVVLLPRGRGCCCILPRLQGNKTYHQEVQVMSSMMPRRCPAIVAPALPQSPPNWALDLTRRMECIFATS